MLLGCSAPATEEAGLTPSRPVDSSGGHSLQFDGIDDFASTGTAGFPHVRAEQSLSLWVCPTLGRTGREALLVLRKGFESGVELALEGGVPVALNTFGPRDFARGAEALSAEWHHLAFVFDGGEYRLYVDGAVAGSREAYETTNRTPTLGFVGSADGFSEFFRGELDEVRVFRRALATAEVEALAAGDAAPDDSEQVLHLTFDEAAGARAFDRSPFGNDAELGDGATERMPARAGDRR